MWRYIIALASCITLATAEHVEDPNRKGIPATVRIHHERSSDSMLEATVETDEDTFNLKLRKIVSPSFNVHELKMDNGNPLINKVNVKKSPSYYEDYETGSTVFLNDHNTVEGILNEKKILKFNNGKHVLYERNDKPKSTESLIDMKLKERNSNNGPQSRSLPYVADLSNQAMVNYSVEILVCIDSSIASRFESDWYVIEYIRMYFMMVDRRFRTVVGAKIDLRISGILISRSYYSDSFLVEQLGAIELDEMPSLNKFSGFLRQRITTLPKHDVAHLMTDKDIVRVYSSGYVNHQSRGNVEVVGGVCNISNYYHSATGMVEDDGVYSGMLMSAQVIALNLGSLYDGYGTASSCHSGRYIMSRYYYYYTYYDMSSRFQFSTCSSVKLRAIYDADHKDCLKTISGSSLPFSNNFPGARFSLNEQCQQRTGIKNSRAIYNSNSYATTHHSLDNYCTRLVCIVSINQQSHYYYSQFPAIEGTKCPHGFCYSGKCRPLADCY